MSQQRWLYIYFCPLRPVRLPLTYCTNEQAYKLKVNVIDEALGINQFECAIFDSENAASVVDHASMHLPPRKIDCIHRQARCRTLALPFLLNRTIPAGVHLD